MDQIVLLESKIPFLPQRDVLQNSPFFHGDPNRAEIVENWNLGVHLARPKAIARQVAIQVGATGRVESIGGEDIHSPLLDKNLAGQEQTFVYAATCGQELANFDPGSDPDIQSALFVLRMHALKAAQNRLIQLLQERFHTQSLAAMNPGSLPIWPLSQQKPIFALLGEGLNRIGVVLDQQGFLKPAESAYGILFETEHPYENCMICKNLDCPGRRAAYDETMAALYR